MLFYCTDENSPRFPQHNGHRGWQFEARTVEGAAIEDLFWRRVQASPTFAREVVRTVWPAANSGKRDASIRPDLYVSLLPESCGAYTFGAWGGLYPLRGDASDTKRIEQGAQRSDRGGYYPGPLIAKHKGWLLQNVVPNLLQAMGQKLAVTNRFRFNLKANHRQELMGTALSKEDVEAIVKMAYPVIYGLSSWTVYWYKTENGNVSHGVVYFYDSLGHVHKLTISAWQPDFPSAAKVVYDLLNIAPPYPLYDLDKIVQHRGARYAIIFPSEATVDYIRTDHAWIPKIFPVTTSASIDGADWTKLKGMTPVIFPEATAWGCHEAFRLHATLEKQGLKPLYIKRQKDEGCESIPFIQDLGMLAIPHSACRFPEFAAQCQQVFGVEPPAGVLSKGVPLSALPRSAVPPEVLMDGLLHTGEVMMVYAWRGIGKSLFAMLLALCFASGKWALNGRVCPSRKYRVLLVDGEMSGDSLIQRGERLCYGHGLPEEALHELIIRSTVAQNKKIELETDAGFADLEPDMKAADIIILDSIFKFFPSSMSPEFSAIEKLQKCIDWARDNEKTLIMIDHEGKGGTTSYGSMGKEISIDTVLRLHRTKRNTIEASVQKVRNHAQPTEAYLETRIEADEKGKKIAFIDGKKSKAMAPFADESADLDEAESQEPSAVSTQALDEAIKEYVREHPDAAQGVIEKALKGRGYGGRSTVQARIKILSEAGKLPDWQNRTKTHKVAEQAAPEGDEN